MVESCPRQDHGVVIGPFRGVAPAGPGTVPVVAPCGIADDALRKALPHGKGEIHLGERKVKTEVRGENGDKKEGNGEKQAAKTREEEGERCRRRKSTKRCKQVFKTHRNTQDLSSL